MAQNNLFVKSLFLALVYWVGSAYRSHVLVQDTAFGQFLYSGAALELGLRIGFVLIVLFLGWRWQRQWDAAAQTLAVVEREHEELEAGLDSLAAGVVIVDGEGRIKKTNGWLPKAVGYSEAELLETDFVQQLVDPTAREDLKQTFFRHNPRRQGLSSPSLLRTKDGGFLHVLISGASHRRADMNGPGLLLLIQDNSQLQKRCDAAVQKHGELKEACEEAAQRETDALQRCSDLEEQHRKLQAQLKGTANELEEQESALKETTAELERLHQAHAALEEKHRQLASHRDQAQKTLQEREAALREAVQYKVELQREMQNQQGSLEELEEQNQTLISSVAQAERRLSDLHTECGDLREAHGSTVAKLQALEEDYAELKSRKKKLKAYLDALQKAMQNMPLPTGLTQADFELIAGNQQLQAGSGGSQWIAENFGVQEVPTLCQAFRQTILQQQPTQVPVAINGTEALLLMVPLDVAGNPMVFFTATDVTALKGQIADGQNKIDEIQDELTERQREIYELEGHVNQINQEKAEVESQKGRLLTTIEQTEAEVRILQQREERFEEEVKQLQEEIHRLKQAKDRQDNEVRVLEDERKAAADGLEQAKSELQRFKQRWEKEQELKRGTVLPMLLLQPDGQIMQASAGMEKLMGWKQQEWKTSYFQSWFVHEQDREQFQHDLQWVLQGDEIPVRAAELAGVDGSPVVAGRCLSRWQGEGTSTAVLVVIHNVSEAEYERQTLKHSLAAMEMQLEAALGELESERDRFHGILQAVDDGLILTDVYHRVVQMNRTAEDILDVRLSEVLERPVRFAVNTPDIVAHLEAIVLDGCTRRTVVIPGARLQLSGDLELTMTLVKNKNTKPMCVVSRIRLLPADNGEDENDLAEPENR